MGIFSRFGKKNQEPGSVEDHESSNGKRGSTSVPSGSGNTLAPLTSTTVQQRDISRATALKIDAIESEMAFEFVNPAPNNSNGRPPAAPEAPENAKTALSTSGAGRTQSSTESTTPLPEFAATIPLPEFAATVPLLDLPLNINSAGADDTPTDAAPLPPPSAPAIEEAAILFANGQTGVAEQILQGVLQDETLGAAMPIAWCMLLDLYQVTGRHEPFDTLSIAYASKFETSPPAWIDAPALSAANAPTQKQAATPSVAFTGALDAQISKQLARAQKLATDHTQLRLEFTRITTVNPIGCGLLLRVLKKLQKSELELILVGAPELAQKIRAILEVGRRDETEAPWLLLLEILRLLNREQEFEESSIDYCVTFEVSPPAFVAPQTKVSTANEDTAVTESDASGFSLPLVIEGNDVRTLSTAIIAFAALHDPVILDCSRLARLDFSAAGQLFNELAAVTAGKTIELHNVNYLVTPLLYVLELQHVVRIFPRKN